MDREQDMFFDQLYRAWYPSVYRYAETVLGDPAAAEEVAQDTFLTALVRLDVLVEAEQPERWLIKAAKYKMLHVFREREKQTRLVSLEDEGAPEPVALDELGRAEEREELARMTEKIRAVLSQEELELLRKIVLEEKGHQEASKEMGISLWASQKKMQRIRKKLRKQFPEYGRKGEKLWPG